MVRQISFIAFISLLGLLLSSCTTNSSEETNLSVESEFEVLDSLKIPYLGYLYFSDISYHGNKFLLYDPQRHVVVTVNRSGEIISEFSKQGDVPDAYGFLYALPAFDMENNIIIHGMKGTMYYDAQGNFIKKLKDPLESFGGVSIFRNGLKPRLHYHKHKTFIINRYTGEKAHDSNGIPMYEQTPMIEINDLSDPEKKQLILIPATSVFTDGLIYWESDYWPVSCLIENKLYVAIGMDPHLYVYELSDDFEVLSEEKILLPYENFNPWQGDDPKAYSKGMAMARSSTPTTLSLESIGKHLVMEFYQGLTKKEDQELQLYFKEDREKASIFSKQLREKYKRKLLVWDPENLKLIKSVTIPKHIVQGFVMRNNEVWYVKQQSSEIEEDVITLYKVKIN
jgi:hypothetical protein